jgi:hypothetical protein
VRTPLALLVEALWSFAAVAVFVQLFGEGDGPAPSMITVAAVVFGSFALARAVQPADGGGNAAIALAAGIVAAAVAVALTVVELSDTTLGSAITALVALVALAVRGVRRGSSGDLESEDVLASASIGFVPVVIAALSDPPVHGDASWGVLAFAYGVLAIGTLAAFNAPERATVASIGGGWVPGIAVLSAITLAVALAIGAFGDSATDALSPLGGPLEPAGRALRDFVLAPIIWVVAQPFRFLAWLVGLANNGQETMRPLPQQMEEKPAEDNDEQPGWVRALTIAGASVAAALALSFAVWLIWRALRRRGHRGGGGGEPNETVEPVPLGLDLGGMLGAIRGRFRRGRAANAVAIRRLYGEMLTEAEERGLSRPASATPLQFAPSLDARFGSGVPSEISEAFVESRYAERVVDEERVRRLEERWADIQHYT